MILNYHCSNLIKYRSFDLALLYTQSINKIRNDHREGHMNMCIRSFVLQLHENV